MNKARQSNINEESSNMQSIRKRFSWKLLNVLSSSTKTKFSPTKAATLLNFVVDQGPGAVGVGVASLMYAAMSSLPYWLPAFAAGKKRRRKRHDYDHRF